VNVQRASLRSYPTPDAVGLLHFTSNVAFMPGNAVIAGTGSMAGIALIVDAMTNARDEGR